MSFVNISDLQLFILILSSLVLIVAGLFLLSVFVFSAQVKLRRSLSQQAVRDYKNARGAFHLELMTSARDRLNTQYDDCNEQISSDKHFLSALGAKQRNELRRTLSNHIVATRLIDVPGIGHKLSTKITRSVYHGSLSDLRNAYRVYGVGETRQYDINRWVNAYEQLIPQLLQQDFPGKHGIIENYAARRRGSEESLDRLTVQAGELKRQLDHLTSEIERLQQVTSKDFVNAVRGEHVDQQALDHYQRGAFAEWEAMPDWFKTTVLAEQA